MTEKFRNKYRVNTTRLDGYDYTRNGAYFVTICTKKHICYFGEIIVETGLRPVSTNNIMDSNNKIVSSDCNNPDYLISRNTKIILSDEGKIVSDCWFDLSNHYLNLILDEFIIMPNHIHGIIHIQNPASKQNAHGLSEFIRAYKSFSSRKINKFRRSNFEETWQPRFYDHIIRSNNELDRIRTYIKNNPENWVSDEYNIRSINM